MTTKRGSTITSHRRAVFISAMMSGLLSLSCATSGRNIPHRGMEKIWNQYSEIPTKRALALAGDPSRNWVAGSSGGHKAQLDADESALNECRRRRGERRIQASCQIYARGNRIVWNKW